MWRSAIARTALLAAVALAGCSAKPADGDRLAAPEPVFEVERFFTGQTQGTGTLKIMTRSPQPIRVQGRGRVDPDGTLVLNQLVARGDMPAKPRQWRIRPVGGGKYEGSLTDATDRIEAQVTGNLLHLRFPMRGGVMAEQWLYMQPDRRTVDNRMAVTKFGVVVARLNEVIRKIN